MKQFQFVSLLEEQTKDYTGRQEATIRFCPLIYQCLTNLLSSPDINRNLRHRLFGAIGYFIVPHDLYPEEEHGPIGYIDDIMLSLSVIRDLREIHGVELIYENWNGTNAEIDYLLDIEFDKLQVEYQELFSDLMDYMSF